MLSLLVLRPYTTYELAKQMERSLHWFWPRAESKLYEEPKRLAALGMATAGHSWIGRRRRTTYRITRSGRAALRRWLADREISPPRLECEWILRVFAADNGSVADLLACVDATLVGVAAMQSQGREIAEQALAGHSLFPHRLHVIALVHGFLWEYSEAMRRWAEMARDELQQWDTTLASDEKNERALDRLRATVDKRNPEPRVL
jgi:DNA-binding PadR family transcriptional regulator